MEKCPCEDCVLIAICKPLALSLRDDEFEDDRIKTDHGLIYRFVFDTINYHPKNNCALLTTYLGIIEEINDNNGRPTYSVKTKKVIAVGKALGFDMSEVKETK